MGGKKLDGVPAPLESARRRFERWRRSRKAGTRIPESLWAAAVKLAGAYGVYPTAKALRVNYYALKKRLNESSPSGPVKAAPAGFVELTAPVWTGGPECTLELEDAEGCKMRIHLKGVEAPDLASLSRSLWGVE